MPKKTRKQRRPELGVLGHPIVCPRGALRGDVWSEENKPARSLINEEMERRLAALFDIYGAVCPPALLDRGLFEPGAKFEPEILALVDLVMRMAREKFPRAFELVPEGGTHKTKKRTWTADRRYELIVFFRHCLRAGLTQEQAGELYIKRYKHLDSGKRITEHYRQAEAWWANRDNITDMDRVDLLNYLIELTRSDSWNSDEGLITADDVKKAEHCILETFKQTVPGFPA